MTETRSSAAKSQDLAVQPARPPESRRQQIVIFQTSIAELLARADQLAIPFVAIHLDHALALCSEELAKPGDKS